MKSMSALLLWLLAAECVLQANGVPSFDINLDMRPDQRWRHVARYYRDEVIGLTQSIHASLERKLGSQERNMFLRYARWDPEYEAELHGWVNEVQHPSVTLNSLKTINMLYEMQSPIACAGVIWATQNGTVVHGRNLDYKLHFKTPNGQHKSLKDATFEAVFQRGGRAIMKSVGNPGLVGITTAMRYGGWSFQQNTRLSANDWRGNLQAAQNGGEVFGLAARRLMETVPDYRSAALQLYATKFMAPQYFVLTGSRPFEGAVLTIDRLGQHLQGTPGIQSVGPTANHLVQTNDDILGTPRDQRRVVANSLLQSLAKDSMSTTDSMMQFLHTSRLYNEMTMYSTVMVPATGYFKTTLPNEPPYPLDGDSLMKGGNGAWTGFKSSQPAYGPGDSGSISLGVGMPEEGEGGMLDDSGGMMMANDFGSSGGWGADTQGQAGNGMFEFAGMDWDKLRSLGFDPKMGLLQASSSVRPATERNTRKKFLESKKQAEALLVADALSLMQVSWKFEA